MRAITKFSDLQQQLQILALNAPGAAKAIATEFAAESASIGKSGQEIPKKTGNMRSTSRVEVEKNSVKFVVGGIIGNPTRRAVKGVLVDYAKWVNDGTSRQRPQFFMERIVAKATLKTGAIHNKAIKSWFAHIRKTN